ncbi:penicillin-binding protein activator [Marinomonas sp. TI.3.20]|uniref:penicillin-binding protein activator n=1 Tax=Marinomonas sp. TI.3.20 TaxID=3121296 RepID=UPI00311FD4AF
MSLINLRIISLTVCALLLSACSSTNLNRSQDNLPQYAPPGSQESGVPDSIYHPYKAPKELTDAYDNALQSYKDGDYLKARDALGDKILTTPSRIQFKALLLASLIAAKRDDPMSAMDLLAQAEALPSANETENQIQISETKATIFEHTGNWSEAIKLRLSLDDTLTGDNKKLNQAQLWTSIQNLTDTQVLELKQANLPNLNGWLTISNILRNQTLSIEQQLVQFQQWQGQHPEHPAAINPPLDFQVIAKLGETPPTKIVLMLPMSGKLERASQAIIKGFFSAYYHQTNKRADIAIVNTNDYKEISDAIAAANQLNPDVIIGPLKKNNVARISQMSLEHPVIALNQLESNAKVQNLFYFSLSSEDDIHELISFAKQAGAKKAAILSTQDTWALRQSDEFLQTAQKDNISVTANLSYKNTSSDRQRAVQKLLLINESKQRIAQIENWTGEKADSVVRPRQDLDYIYFVGKLSEAKQVRPLLDYYFAQSIPMLSSSTLNDTPPEQNINFSDIERIIFTEIPAIAQKNNTLNEVSTDRDSNILRRLHALGADAYLLANRFPLFVQLKSTRLSANTGIITMDKNGIFHKRPEIMTYQRGHLVNAISTQFFHKAETSDAQK